MVLSRQREREERERGEERGKRGEERNAELDTGYISFVNRLEAQLNIVSPEDWYKVTAAEIAKNGGFMLVRKVREERGQGGRIERGIVMFV